MRSILFTGTGTDIGKTYCAVRWIEMRHQCGQRIGVYKPVASGCFIADAPQGKSSTNPDNRFSDDAQQLWQACGGHPTWPDLGIQQVCPQQYLASLSPPLAAQAEGQTVDESQLLTGIDVWESAKPDWLVIEGAGGLFSPLSDRCLNIDFVKQLKPRLPNLHVVVVTANRLGVIHDTVACVRAAEAQGILVDAIWLNAFQDTSQKAPDASIGSNRSQIARWSGRPVIESADELNALLG